MMIFAMTIICFLTSQSQIVPQSPCWVSGTGWAPTPPSSELTYSPCNRAGSNTPTFVHFIILCVRVCVTYCECFTCVLHIVCVAQCVYVCRCVCVCVCGCVYVRDMRHDIPFHLLYTMLHMHIRRVSFRKMDNGGKITLLVGEKLFHVM